MKRRSIVLLVLVFAVGLLAGRGLSQTPPPAKRDGRSGPMVLVPTSTVAPLPEGLTPEEQRDIEVFRRAQGSVVFITSIALRRDVFTMDVQQIPQGSGSGFVWDRQGHVVTRRKIDYPANAFF